MRLSISIPDPMYKAIKEDYERIGFTSLNDFILDCIRKSELYGSSMHQSGATLQNDMHQNDADENTEEEQASEQPEYGKCPYCYSLKPQIVKLVTYKDGDLVRVEGKLCDKHINLSKTSGSFVGYGGLEDNV